MEKDKKFPPFASMVKHFREKVNMNEVLSNFGPDHSIEDMFSYFWNLEDAHCYLTPYFSKGGKSIEKALSYRLDAQKKFREKNYEEAMQRYNLSIMLAPHPTVSRREGLPINDDPGEPSVIVSENMGVEISKTGDSEVHDEGGASGYSESHEEGESSITDSLKEEIKEEGKDPLSKQLGSIHEKKDLHSVRPKIHIRSRSGYPKDNDKRSSSHTDSSKVSSKGKDTKKGKSHSECRADGRDQPKASDLLKYSTATKVKQKKTEIHKMKEDKGKNSKNTLGSDIKNTKGSIKDKKMVIGNTKSSTKPLQSEKSIKERRGSKGKSEDPMPTSSTFYIGMEQQAVTGEGHKEEQQAATGKDYKKEQLLFTGVGDTQQGATALVTDDCKKEIDKSFPSQGTVASSDTLKVLPHVGEATKIEPIEEVDVDCIAELVEDLKRELSPDESFERQDDIGELASSDNIQEDLQRASDLLLELEIAIKDKYDSEITEESKERLLRRSENTSQSKSVDEGCKIEVRKDLTGANVGSGTSEDHSKSEAKEDDSSAVEDKYTDQEDQDPSTEEGNDESDQNRDNEENELDSSNQEVEASEQSRNREFEFLSSAYEIRASFLYRLKEYEKSIIDIDRALRTGCSPKSEHALCVVKEHCFDEIEKDLKRKCKEKGLIFSYKTSDPPSVQEVNSNIPAMSSAIKVAYSPRDGRHLVAARDIRPGEVLCVEEPYCAAVNLNEMSSHCSTCFRRTTIPLPCPNCSLVTFCSEQCAMRDSKHQHWFMCRILPSVVSLKLSDYANLVLHLMVKTTYCQVKERAKALQKEEIELPPRSLGMNEHGFYDSSDYRSVFHLQANEDKRSPEELFEVCSETFGVLKLLKMSRRYFVDEKNEPIEPSPEDYELVGKAAYRHLLNVRSSAINIGELKVVVEDYEKSWVENVGCGIYPATSLINHSCHPNVALYNHGKTLVLHSIRSIPKDHPIMLSYGAKHRLVPNEFRHEVLRENYFYDCNCEACQDGWYPEFDDLFELKCVKCNKGIDMQKGMCNNCQLYYREGKEYKVLPPYNFFTLREQIRGAAANCKRIKLKILKADGTQRDRETVINAIEFMEKYAKVPCTMLFDAQDTLRLSFEKDGSHVYVKNNASSNQNNKKQSYYINSAWSGRRDISFEQSPKKSPKKRARNQSLAGASIVEMFDVKMLDMSVDDIEKHYNDED